LNFYPRERKLDVQSSWKIKKDDEPGPGAYENTPALKTQPRQIWAKEKKVTYMETHMNKKKPIPAPGIYKDVEVAKDKAISARLGKF
jgi:hypothetical protein